MELTAHDILAILPVAAALTTAVKLILGIRTIGVFAPALLALTVLELGAVTTLLCLVTALGAGLAVSPLVDRLALARASRLGLILVAVCSGLLATGVVAEDESGLPLVVLTIVAERVWESARATGARGAARLFVATGTAAFAIAGSVVVLQPVLLWGHWTVASLLGAGVTMAVGSYRGLRLTELGRFENLLGASVRAGGGDGEIVVAGSAS